MKKPDYPLVTRIAPAPTGDMHLGTVRTAYFNWLAAKATDGKMLLRIDDTNAERNSAAAYNVIRDTLRWLGINYAATIHQSERTDLYKTTAYSLRDAGYAVELDNGAIALKWNDSIMPRFWMDEIAGEVKISDADIEKRIDGKLILLKGTENDNAPTYALASVVDDYKFNVNYIIRGNDHTSNTGKQVAIWTALEQVMKTGRKLPLFAHVGLIMKDKKKLSKRDNAASALTYRDQGYDPDALLNFLLRMGWAPTVDNKENSILPRDSAVRMFFDEGSMRNSNAGFDQAKLNWFNKRYKKLKADKELMTQI